MSELLEEYRVSLDFRPRVQLLSKLATALEEYEPGLEEILVEPGASGGVVLVVRCDAPDPSATRGLAVPADAGEAGAAAPAVGPPLAVADAAPGRARGGRRREVSAPASSTDRDPGALSAKLEQLLRILHVHDGSIGNASGRATAIVAEAGGWSLPEARRITVEAQSIGLVSRKVNGSSTFEVALTPVGLAAYDRLEPVEEPEPSEPGGGAPAGAVDGADRDALMDRRRAAAAAAI